MTRLMLAAVLAFSMLLGPLATVASAETACIDCQNDCFAQVKTCRKHHAEKACMEAYGTCKVACKGSPVCTENCVPVKGHAKKDDIWHGAKCYSGQGCHCEALKCPKAPHYRDAKCFSPPG